MKRAMKTGLIAVVFSLGSGATWAQSDVADLIDQREQLKAKDFQISMKEKELELKKLEEEIALLEADADKILTAEDVRAMIADAQANAEGSEEAQRRIQQLQARMQVPSNEENEGDDKPEPAVITGGMVTSIYRNKPGGAPLADVVLRDGTTAILEEGQKIDGWEVHDIQLKKVVLGKANGEKAVLRYGIIR